MIVISSFLYILFIYWSDKSFLGISAFSFSPIGNWTLSRDPSRECVHEFLCTPSNYTWYGDSDSISEYNASNPWIVYNSTTGCEALLKKGIRKIYFHGDSYMRQMYTGLFLLLSGNYKNGSLIESEESKTCEYHKQLYEKRCGVQLLNHYGFVCNGKVHLDPLLNGLNNLNHCSELDKNVILFSFGNHKTQSGNGGRWGVNNATIYKEFFEDYTCPGIRENTNKLCNVYWVSTHYRLVTWFEDERPEVIQQFNEEMREFFDTNKCGSVGYIDVYNMTRQLALNHPEDSERMTFDRVHWGMQVNLLKGQIILNTLIQAPENEPIPINKESNILNFGPGHDNFENERINFISSYEGKAIRGNGRQVYLCKQGILRPIPDLDTFFSLQLDLEKIIHLNERDMKRFDIGEMIAHGATTVT